jgi:hypothetical protein
MSLRSHALDRAQNPLGLGAPPVVSGADLKRTNQLFFEISDQQLRHSIIDSVAAPSVKCRGKASSDLT